MVQFLLLDLFLLFIILHGGLIFEFVHYLTVLGSVQIRIVLFTFFCNLIEHEHAHAAALARQDHLKHLLTPILLGGVNLNETRVDKFAVRAHNGFQEELHDGAPAASRYKSNLLSYFQQVEFPLNFAEQNTLVCFAYFEYFCGRHQIGRPRLLEFLNALLLEGFKYLVRATLVAVDGSHAMHEELDEDLKVALVRYNQIEVTIRQLQREAMPTVEG